MMNKTYRMYSLVLYQLSGIQAGIQAGHSHVEYGKDCMDKDLYNEWAKNHKTVMVMNGGSTTSIRDHFTNLTELGVDVIPFHEPDLDNIVTAISFIVSDDYFETEGKNYPDNPDPLYQYLSTLRFHGGR